MGQINSLPLYEQVLCIRTFEELVLDLFRQNKLSGTTHTYIGEEATAVALMQFVGEDDYVFSNHRCHGHCLAYGVATEKLLAEIMSKVSGLCEGRGGSQHIHYKNFYTNGIQGGIVPNAVGVALANKLSGSSANTVVFLGDGTLGQGVVYESLNIAAAYSIPVMFIVEDNQYAMSTKRIDVIAGDVATRMRGFDIHTLEIESTDLDALKEFFDEAFSYLHNTRKPICAIVHNYRLGAHSKGDDTRNPAEIEIHRQNDPVLLIESKLGKDKADELRTNFRQDLEQQVAVLEKESALIVREPHIANFEQRISFLPTKKCRYIEALQATFNDAMRQNNNIIFLGEDICDPYGGAFKATKGLSSLYGERVLNMPISEAAMVGIGVGLALNHKTPVVEMMFGDFVTLAFDQLLNHAAKYGWVYGNNVSIPLVVRTPMGGKRGYGPTHSQSLEKFLIGIPLIRVLSLSLFHDPQVFYQTLFKQIKEPTVVIENKKLYGEKLPVITNGCYLDFSIEEVNHYGYSTLHLSMDLSSNPDVYLITYGDMVKDAMEAAEELMMQEEIQLDLIVISQLSPLPLLDIKEIIATTAPIVFLEEGTKTGGIGSEYIASLVEMNVGTTYYRIAALDMPIPNGVVLESQILPNKDTIVKKIKEVI